MNESEQLIFNPDKQTILLHVDNKIIDLEIARNFAEQEHLHAKHEFHVTLVGNQTGLLLLQQDFEFSVLTNLAKSYDWNFTFTKELYFITRHYFDEDGNEEVRKSIIQKIDLPDIVSFYEKLNELTPETFAVPFPHVTLFTTSTKPENLLHGIGIYSQEDFEKLSPIDIVFK